MSYYGNPRFSGGGQIFPNNQFQQQVLQVQMQLQRNLQNIQNRHNAPNPNLKNLPMDNSKIGSKPGSVPQFNQNKTPDNIIKKDNNAIVKGPNENRSIQPNSGDKVQSKPNNLPPVKNEYNSNTINSVQNAQRNSNSIGNSKTEKPVSPNAKPEKHENPAFKGNSNKPPLFGNKPQERQQEPSRSLMGKPPLMGNHGINNYQNSMNSNNQMDGRHNHNKNPPKSNFNPKMSGHRPVHPPPPQVGTGRDFKGPQKFFGMDKIKERAQLISGPQIDLPTMDMSEKKFTNFAKLFVGNIPKNSNQEEVAELFKKFGEVGNVYLNKDSSFAFIQLDYKGNAQKAVRELDNQLFKGRNMKVRFASVSEGIRVKNLSHYVSNELLEKSFSIFGPIDSCRILSGDRGLSKGEGVVIFKDKKSAFLAVKKCQEECFFLTSALRPAIVTTLDISDEGSEGLPETNVIKNDEYHNERQVGPHFAENQSFEFDFGNQWKQLYNMYEEKKSALDRDFQIELERLEKKMTLAKVEYEAEKLRKELAQREAESAELRRHFEARRQDPPPPLGPNAPVSYDSYAGGKRPPPSETGFDPSFSAPYDQYPESYERGTYPPAGAYAERGYERGAYEYGREDYRREGAYGHERYERPGEIPSERVGFEGPADPPGYGAPPVGPYPNEPYQPPVPNKRPRY